MSNNSSPQHERTLAAYVHAGKRSLTYTERQLREFGEQLGAFLAVRETSPALLRYAREEQRAYRASVGYRASNAPLLTAPGSQTKLGKSGTPTYGLMLVPERGIGKHNGRQLNLCPAASLGCAAACLMTPTRPERPAAFRPVPGQRARPRSRCVLPKVRAELPGHLG